MKGPSEDIIERERDIGYRGSCAAPGKGNTMKTGKKRIEKALLLILALLMLCGTLLSSCGGKPASETKIEGLPIQHEPEFGGVYIEITIDDLKKMTLEYTDTSDNNETKEMPRKDTR